MNYKQQLDQREFSSLFDAYRNEPNDANGKALVAFMGKTLPTRGLAGVGPCLAISEVVMGRLKKRPSLHLRILYRFGLWLLRKKLTPDRPGWNDYLMVRWQLTHESTAAYEIHRRTHYFSGKFDDPSTVPDLLNPRAAIGWTAQWMVQSQRSEDPKFDEAMRIEEGECNICTPAKVLA